MGRCTHHPTFCFVKLLSAVSRQQSNPSILFLFNCTPADAARSRCWLHEVLSVAILVQKSGLSNQCALIEPEAATVEFSRSTPLTLDLVTHCWIPWRKAMISKTPSLQSLQIFNRFSTRNRSLRRHHRIQGLPRSRAFLLLKLAHFGST